jgi:hypothetical protein
MDVLDKYKFDSITAQLKLDLPNHTKEDRAKYIELIEIMLESYMLEDLEVNGGKQNFTRFIDSYADKLFAWKSQNN